MENAVADDEDLFGSDSEDEGAQHRGEQVRNLGRATGHYILLFACACMQASLP